MTHAQRKQYLGFVPLAGVVLLLLVALGLGSAATTWAQTRDLAAPAVLRIGLIPEQDLFVQKKRYQPLIDYLAEELGVSMELQILPRYGNLIDNFNDLELDAAFFGSFTGALAIKKLGMIPLARPHSSAGLSSYYGMIFVRRDSDIASVADMRGKRMVFVDRATTAGYLLPLDYFKEHGVDDYTTWFGNYYFSGTHEDAILEVLNGHADIGAAKSTIFYQLAQNNPRIIDELQILATSPHVPANALGVRHDLADTLITRLRQTLLAMDQTPAGRSALDAFGAHRFIATGVEDYRPVFDYADHIGLDLNSYQYVND